jgi:hypothetical protein
VDPEVCARNPGASQRDHALALIESDDVRSASDHVGRVEAGAACSIENTFALHVTQQAETGRTVIVRVVEAVDRVVEELVRERFVLRLPAHLIAHGTNHRTMRSGVRSDRGLRPAKAVG